MNISKILLVFVIAISLVSCKKDDDGATAFVLNQTNLLGTYALNYAVTTDVETININGLDIVTTTTTTGDTFQMEVSFLENNTYVTDGAYRQMYTVVVAGQTVEDDSEIIVADNETANFTVSSGTSTLTLDGDTYEVTSFSETEMTITLEEIVTETNGDTTVYNEEFRFTKI